MLANALVLRARFASDLLIGHPWCCSWQAYLVAAFLPYLGDIYSGACLWLPLRYDWPGT